MIRLGIVPIDEVFTQIYDGRGRPDRLICGQWIHMESIRYKVFRQSLSCKHCGLRGEYFAVEKHIHGYDASVENTRYHLNLYARVGDEEILFTKDHILPKSLGGKDDLENLQTLCVKCNHKKGNNIIKDQHLIPWPSKRIKMKMIAEAVKQKKGVVYGGICNVF